VHDQIPVFVDGGVRRGTDVFKALVLGAKAVGIGCAFLLGLGAFGQADVVLTSTHMCPLWLRQVNDRPAILGNGRRRSASPEGGGNCLDGLIESGVACAHEWSPCWNHPRRSPLDGRAGVWWM
jgi:hypothetical protein